MTFNELGISVEIESALAKLGITEPSKIQSTSIPILLEGQNASMSSETGTGKTLAYLLPILTQIDTKKKDLHSIIIVPTHELAFQIHNQIIAIEEQAKLGLRSMLLLGGTSVERQKEKLKKKPQIVIGSCGRILELINLKKLKAHAVQTLVIDEADKQVLSESLSQIRDITKPMQKTKQTVFVSATEQSESLEILETLAPGIKSVHSNANKINDDIEHHYIVAHGSEKPDMLRRAINAIEPTKALVFVHRNSTADFVTDKLIEGNIPTESIHGECTKDERKHALKDFRSGKLKVLVSSDLSARGLDVKDMSHVFNYDPAKESSDYLHRAGRTGRAGNKGCAISIVSPQETKIIRRYQRDLNISFLKTTIDNGVVKSRPGEDINDTEEVLDIENIEVRNEGQDELS
mgnify:CR=1 FL=1